MISEFQYKGFSPDDHVVAEAEGILDRIRDLTPASSKIVAHLTFDQGCYLCTIDVLFRRDSFFTSTVDYDVFKSLYQAELAIVEKIKNKKQRLTQFFSKNTEGLTKKNQDTFDSLENN